MCGYKKTHPLEESIKLILSLNHKHKIAKKNEIQKFQAVTTILMEQLDEIMNELKIILKATEKSSIPLRRMVTSTCEPFGPRNFSNTSS